MRNRAKWTDRPGGGELKFGLLRRTTWATPFFVVLGMQAVFGDERLYQENPVVAWETSLQIVSQDLVAIGEDGFAACGVEAKIESSDRRPALVRLKGNGEVLWHKNYDRDAGSDWLSLCEARDGGLVATGGTGRSLSIDDELIVVRVSGSGSVVWSRRFPGDGSSRGTDVIETKSGDFVVAGYACDRSGNPDVVLLLVDRVGRLRWRKTYGGEGGEGYHDGGTRVARVGDGGYIVVGTSDSRSLCPVGVGQAIYVVRTDGLGNRIWERTYGREMGVVFEGSNVLIGPTGGVIVAGTRVNDNPGLVLLRLGQAGDQRSNWVFGLSNPQGPVGIDRTHDGGFILGNRDLGSFRSDAYLVRTSAKGEKQWDLRMGERGYVRVLSVVSTRDDGCVALCVRADGGGFAVRLRVRSPKSPNSRNPQRSPEPGSPSPGTRCP